MMTNEDLQWRRKIIRPRGDGLFCDRRSRERLPRTACCICGPPEARASDWSDDGVRYDVIFTLPDETRGTLALNM